MANTYHTVNLSSTGLEKILKILQDFGLQTKSIRSKLVPADIKCLFSNEHSV